MRFLLLFIPLFIFIRSVNAQENQCRKSTEGTDFWFGFMENRDGSDERFVEITVTSRVTTNFQIFIGPEQTPFQGTFTVNANDSRQVKIPWELGEILGSEEIQDKGIHLISEEPVNVYALNWDINSADVAVIYPVGSLGKEYFAMCYYPDIDPANPFFGNGRNSEFLVVATENNTSVEITPSKVTDKEWPADSTFTITLNAGQVYQVQSENLPNSDEEGQGDLTGSFISADKPVAFFSGSLATRVPNNQCCWDHLYEQIPPIQAWGREYFTVPLKTREQDRFRIMAADDNTTVYISGRNPFTLNRGEFEELVFRNNEPKRILGDKPILVAQYSQSNAVDSSFTGGDGDPFMTILSTTEQSKNDVTFVTYRSPELDSVNFEYSGIKKYFVNIITPINDVPGMILNGNAIADEFIPFPGNNIYSYAQIELDQGTHRLRNSNPKGGFLAYVYGYGGFESYGYGVGFNLDLVLDLGESIFFEKDTMLLCGEDTLTLDAGTYFDSYNWSTGSDESKIKVTEEGLYFVTTTTNDGCTLTDSVYVFKSFPETNLNTDEFLEECEPFSIELRGDEGYQKYVWQNETGDTLSTQNSIIADENGKYQITVFDKYNCTASDFMELVIHPVPVVEIASENLICGAKSTTLEVTVTGAPESIWNYNGSFTWSTNRPVNIGFSNESHTTVDLTASDWGEYEIYYEITTTDNCTSIDTFTVSFYPVPTSDFQFLDPGRCQEYITQVEYTGDAERDANLIWDFGSSKIIDSIDWNLLNISLGTNGTNPVIQLVVEQNGCFSDTTSEIIRANPDFRLVTNNFRGCDSIMVQFEGELQTPDLVSYEWNFGDGSPISNEQNPVHFYSQPGMYDVDLTVTNQNSGCQIGFQIDSMVKVFQTPIAEISADVNVCHPDTLEIFYTNSIDSTVVSWYFDGIHQVSGDNDSITVKLDKPFGTVGLVVDEFGCVSDTSEIQLKRKPNFDFSTSSVIGCVPYSAEIMAQPFDEMLLFEWITDSVPLAGQSVTRLYQDSGRYDVGLIAESMQTGCTDTLIKKDWMIIYPKPKADFDVNFQVALIDNSNIVYTNLSENADFYYWDFGDGTLSNEKNPEHTFAELGEFTTELIVESVLGCTDTTSYAITIIPGSAFTPNAFRPDSPIEENRTFMPLGQEGFQSNFNLKIYDRWGQLIFESISIANPWDGTDRNGQPAPMGNYLWIADYMDIQGVPQQQKGQVLLIR